MHVHNMPQESSAQMSYLSPNETDYSFLVLNFSWFRSNAFTTFPHQVLSQEDYPSINMM